MVWDSQSNVNRDIIPGLNLSVPRTYRRAVSEAVGTCTYRFTDDPKVILQGLQDYYGQMTPAEKTNMEADWSAAWNPSESIELLFYQFEDCYVLSVAVKPAYTQEQVIYKALTSIQRMGLYLTAFWNTKLSPQKTKIGRN